MSDKKIGPSDFKAEAERLHAAGKMPKLEDLLAAVADTRKEYAPKILNARKQGDDDGSNS
jgi:hypothetical protein